MLQYAWIACGLKVYFGDESEGIWEVNSLCSKTKWGGFDLNWSCV